MRMTLDLDPTVEGDIKALVSVVAGLSRAAPVPNPNPTPVDNFPANPASAPFPSPNNSLISVLNGAVEANFTVDGGGNPYVRDGEGQIWQFKLPLVADASGNYPFTVNGLGTQNWYWFATNIIVWGGTVYYQANGFWYNKDGSYHDTKLPQIVPPPLPVMPPDPMPNPVAPGSSGTVIQVPGASGALAAAVSAAKAGDTLRLTPGFTYKETFKTAVPLLIDGGGSLTGAGTATPSFSGGARIDGSTFTAYAGGGLGGVVAGADLHIKGCEVTGFGLQETGVGGTAGIRVGADCILTVESCYVHDNQDGIFSGGFASAVSLINVWLANNGIDGVNGQSHNIYMSGGTVRLTISGGFTSIVPPMAASSTFPRAVGPAYGGHAVKSRAHAFSMTGPFYVYSSDATPIDLPDGTTLPFTITGPGTIAKAAVDNNHGILGYCAESQNNGAAGGTISNVTVNALCASPFVQIVAGTVTLTGNTLTGAPIVNQGGGSVEGQW